VLRRALILSLLLAAYLCLGTLGNRAWRIKRAFPGVKVSVYEATSPSGHPWDLFRAIYPFGFVGPTESAAISFVALPYPLVFDALRSERIGTIYVRDCVVRDIAAFVPKRSQSPYVAFYRCDLSPLPKDQRDVLRCQWAEAEKMELCSLGAP
jgi:hypothetical protein